MNRRPPAMRPAVAGPRRVGVALLLTAAMLAVCPAAAKTPLEQEWSRYNGWPLAWLRLEGAPPDLSGALKGGLALAGRSRLLRGPALPDFRTRLLQEDLARVRFFLAREGYPAAVVTPRAYPEADRRRLGVVLQIDPGVAVVVAAVERPGWPDDVAPPAGDLAARLLRPGDRFRDADLEAARLRLRRHLRDAGFALAEVGAAVRPVSAGEVVVVHAVTPGERYDITEVQVSGCSADLEPLTRRLLDLRPPVRYAATRLDEAVFDLRSTQLYRQVALEVHPRGPRELRLRAVVENARMRTLAASVGTWSDNPWMVRAGWSHRNLLGGGRGVDVQAGLATHVQTVSGGVTWFGWLTPRARTRAGARWQREDEEAYLSREWGLDLTQSLRPRGRDLFHFGVSLSRVSVTPYSTEDQLVVDREGNLLELWADRKWDWSDDPLFPRTGGFAKLSATWSPPIGLSDTPYLSLQGDLSLYRPLGGGAVLAGRGRAGWARPLGDAEALIPNRRFYAGGYSTMRGYGRRQLGPRDATGVARGGDAVLLAGLEVRAPVVGIVSVAGFLDTGQVWRRPGAVRLADLETAAGLDLDLRTPLGPVRFGYAWSLGRVYPGEPDDLAHFGVGYPW